MLEHDLKVCWDVYHIGQQAAIIILWRNMISFNQFSANLSWNWKKIVRCSLPELLSPPSLNRPPCSETRKTILLWIGEDNMANVTHGVVNMNTNWYFLHFESVSWHSDYGQIAIYLLYQIYCWKNLKDYDGCSILMLDCIQIYAPSLTSVGLDW